MSDFEDLPQPPSEDTTEFTKEVTADVPDITTEPTSTVYPEDKVELVTETSLMPEPEPEDALT
jgi:hypothetical protein